MSEAAEQMPLEIWTDINGNATRTQFKGGVKYIRADERDRLRERLGPQGLEVVMIDGDGHYVNETVKAYIERLLGFVRDFIAAWDHDGEPDAMAYETAVDQARKAIAALTPAAGGTRHG